MAPPIHDRHHTVKQGMHYPSPVAMETALACTKVNAKGTHPTKKQILQLAKQSNKPSLKSDIFLKIILIILFSNTCKLPSLHSESHKT